MGTQVEVPAEHLQALRPQISKIAKGGLNWCIQPRSGEMTVNVTDGAQGMEVFHLVRTAVADRKRELREKEIRQAHVGSPHHTKAAEVSNVRSSRRKASQSGVGSGSTW